MRNEIAVEAPNQSTRSSCRLYLDLNIFFQYPTLLLNFFYWTPFGAVQVFTVLSVRKTLKNVLRLRCGIIYSNLSCMCPQLIERFSAREIIRESIIVSVTSLRTPPHCFADEPDRLQLTTMRWSEWPHMFCVFSHHQNTWLCIDIIACLNIFHATVIVFWILESNTN